MTLKVTVNRTELLAAARRAANVAPSASPLDVLKGTLVEADGTEGKLTLSATNLEISLEQKIPCTCAEEGAFVINAKLLEEMLALLEGDTVVFQRGAGSHRVTVLGGQASYEIPVLEKGAFPKVEIPFPEDTVKVSGIPAMARRSVFATGNDAEQPLLKCVNLRFTKDGLRAVGSDGSCMVSAKGDDKSTGDIELLIPASSLLELARMCGDKDEFRVGSTGKQLVFSHENFTYSARLMDGGYINADGVFASLVNSFTVLTDVVELKRAIGVTTAIASGNAVKLTFSGNRIEFCSRSEDGNSSTAIEVIPLTGLPQGDYWFQSAQLSACLRALTGTVTLGIAQSGVLTLSTDDVRYMQTGMRPQTAKAEKPKKAAGTKKKAA